MKCHLINLDRSPDRLERMRALLSAAGVEFERQPAVDGKLLSAGEQAGVFVPTSRRSPLSAGEIACFLSHRLCWQSIAGGADSHGCVLEDDLHVSPSLARFANASGWIPADADLVKLETWRGRVWLDRAATDAGGGFALRRLRSVHWGGGAYVVSKTAAQRLLGQTRRFSEPVDDFLFNPAGGVSDTLTIYQMSPGLCVQHQYFHGTEAKGDFLSSSLESARSIAPVKKPTIAGKFEKHMGKLTDRVRRMAAGQTRVSVPFDPAAT